MHIVFFLDQHIDSPGGAQGSARLQRKYLERLGHTVSICSPQPDGNQWRPAEVVLPSRKLQADGVYRAIIPTKRLARDMEQQLLALPAIDIIHLQGDFSSVLLGVWFARRHAIPTVLTYHTNLPAGLDATLSPLQKQLVMGGMGVFAKQFIGSSLATAWQLRDPAAFQAELGRHVDLRTAPSQHFARLLEQRGVPAPVHVVSNGIDDDLVATVESISPREPVIVWAGRMSAEKRPLEFLEAVAESGTHAMVDMYGQGTLYEAVKEKVAALHLEQQVVLHGHVSHEELFAVLAKSSILVQSSVGFETQGMTLFEATTFGVHVVVSDPDLVEGLAEGEYTLARHESVSALAEALSTAVRQCEATSMEVREKKTTHLQSRFTGEMMALYESVAAKQ